MPRTTLITRNQPPSGLSVQSCVVTLLDSGWVAVLLGSGAVVAREAHNLEVVGSIPTSPIYARLEWWLAPRSSRVSFLNGVTMNELPPDPDDYDCRGGAIGGILIVFVFWLLIACAVYL